MGVMSEGNTYYPWEFGGGPRSWPKPEYINIQPKVEPVEVGELPNDIGYELAVFLTRQFKTYRSRFKTRTVPPEIIHMLIMKFAESQYAPKPDEG